MTDPIELTPRALVLMITAAGTIAGGTGFASGAIVQGRIEAKVERAETDIVDQTRKIEQHEERLRRVEIDLAAKLASVQSDLREIKRALGVER